MIFVASLLLSLLNSMILAEKPAFRIESARFRHPSEPPRQPNRIRRDTEKASNVTFLLNTILENYDRHFRPGFNTEIPTKVYIDLLVRTMGPVSEMTDTYSFNCYFRQTWTDARLRFNGTSYRQQLSLSMTMLDKIWKPDTYFWNGAISYIHTMTNSNRLVRLSPDGTVLYSSRLTIQGKCAMAMERYPLDRQACRLQLGSYAYSSKELSYTWKIMANGDKGVQLDYEGISDLPQFSVTGFQIFDAVNLTRDRDYSVLEARFYFDRHFGYFLMNFYVPCTLIVLLCWVAFWTNREATGDRMGMGITSVLTMVLIANDSKTDSPKYQKTTWKKKMWGTPSYCYVFERTVYNTDGTAECIEFPVDCDERTPNSTDPIQVPQFCSSQALFVSYGNQKWQQVVNEHSKPKEDEGNTETIPEQAK